MPANERMDWLVEKATELGVTSIQPLATAHGVLRLSGERAEKKRAHWEAIAIAACEQCGRNRVPVIHPVRSFSGNSGWIDAQSAGSEGAAARFVLSLAEGTRGIASAIAAHAPDHRGVLVLSGPEGGLTPAESEAGRSAGFIGVTLGPRILRADTAPLALLATVTC